MAKNLVIVESPAKVKTIKKFLGKDYAVLASYGHVRDLPKSSLGVDVDHDYEPKYITIRGKGDVLAELRKEAKKADRIYLATDPDREGEAISWHLKEALKLDGKKVYRITFNEITKAAVTDSFKHARDINMDLVDSQQTRRILDRVVGYKISPLLWAKIKRGLSAGRVQSAALKMICDREAEIDAFTPREYWSLDVKLQAEGVKGDLIAKYAGDIRDEAEARKIVNEIKKGSFSVTEVKTGERVRKAPLPFTTSTLQQEASRGLNFPAAKTMKLAQQLYEGVELKGEGTVGLITYLRTDSTRIADDAVKSAADYISGKYGKDYLQKASGKQASGKGASRVQDDHEAIRPTDITRIPLEIKEQLSRDQFRLYQLIWKRFAASQMADAVYETTSVKLSAGTRKFTMSASKVRFDGFMQVYKETEAETETEDRSSENKFTGTLDKNTKIKLLDTDPAQHFTQPPAHFTEASLVRAMEEAGIGRPSTYAPTISLILARRYVMKDGRNIFVTDLGEVVNNMMKDAFPTIVDSNFTANMETLLDGIEDGKVKWKTVVENFYPDLAKAVDDAEKELEKVTVKDEETDEVCELCGRNMVIKYGPHGKFLACPGFPECRNTKPYLEKIGVKCPKCGKDIVIRKTMKGRRFYGCIDNPDCDYMVWQKPKAE